MTVSFPALGQVGRIGNQLYELASTIGIALSHNDKPSFPPWDYFPYFSVPSEFFSGAVGTDATYFVPHLDERCRIYLQDYNLWKDADATIREYLRPSFLAEAILHEKYPWFFDLGDFLSVHVRRGDNVPGNDPNTPNKQEYHPMPTKAYYLKGIEQYQNDTVVFFSDDIPWCRENFSELDRKVHFVEGESRPKEHEPTYATSRPVDWPEIHMMAKAQNHVISNSTYAWWGAFLSEDTTPIFPDPWYGWRVTDYVNSDLMFPSTWRKLNYADLA